MKAQIFGSAEPHPAGTVLVIGAGRVEIERWMAENQMDHYGYLVRRNGAWFPVGNVKELVQVLKEAGTSGCQVKLSPVVGDDDAPRKATLHELLRRAIKKVRVWFHSRSVRFLLCAFNFELNGKAVAA